mmetsp:Transcript_102754/g.287994  ORF Transcript_102754/g.287994 Transcript_102754/m.287994 type:complete len:212 (-) Transcript_102754:1043-1678(-)
MPDKGATSGHRRCLHRQLKATAQPEAHRRWSGATMVMHYAPRPNATGRSSMLLLLLLRWDILMHTDLAMPGTSSSSRNFAIDFCNLYTSFACAGPFILVRPSKNSAVSISPSPSSSNLNNSWPSSAWKSNNIHFFFMTGSAKDCWNSSQLRVPLPSASMSRNKFLNSVKSLFRFMAFSCNACSWSLWELAIAFSTMIAVTRFMSTKTANAM